MDDDILLVLLILAAIGWLLIGPIVAWRRAARALAEVAALRAEIAALRAMSATEAPVADMAAVVEPLAAAPAMEDPLAAGPWGAKPAVDEPRPAEPPPVAPEMPEPVAEAGPSEPRPDLEQRLTQRWLVWLGGLALALGGVMVVKAAVDQGWFGPVVRDLMAAALGLALVVAGEWLRQRPGLRGLVADRRSYAPPALAAAGIATLFATVYGAYALHGLLPAGIAFALLALVSALGVLLAWSHGPFLAALGLLGAFAVPLLVDTGDQPDITSLLAYLAAPVLAGVAVLAWRRWWWLGWLVLAAAAAWVVLVLLVPWRAPLPTALFVLGTAIAFAWLGWRLERHGAPLAGGGRRLVLGAFVVTALLLLFQLLMPGPSGAAITALALLALVQLVSARRSPALEWAALVPAIALPLALLLVDVAFDRLGPEILGEPAIGLLPWILLPEAAWSFTLPALGYAALLALAGFAGLWGANRPGLWAGIGATAPLAILAIAHLRIAALTPGLSWAALGLGLALLDLLLAQRTSRFRPGLDGALAAYATGVIGATALAAAMALEQAQLTMVLALQLPAIGWVARRVEVPALRRVASVLAAIVVLRAGLGSDLAATLDWNAAPPLARILYGQGVPLLAFLAAAYLFRRDPPDRLSLLLQSGALVFWLLLLFLLVRRLLIASDDGLLAIPLAEAGAQASLWLATAWGLLRRARGRPAPVERGGALLLGLGALWMLLALALVDQNPLLTGDAVGAMPILNILLIAYGVPAVLLGLLALELRRHGQGALALATGAMALLWGLLYLGLELRHAFQGTVLDGPGSDGESWAYSALLLLYAGALLVAGIWRQDRMIRYASLAVLMLGVAKVFLLDLGDLEGLWRAGSLIGLGLSLVLIGLVYQRFVFPASGQGGSDEEEKKEEAPG